MELKTHVNISEPVANYYAGYDLSALLDTLLDIYDITALSVVERTPGRRVERSVTITNEAYINLYNVVGSHSKQISLARLLEYCYGLDVLSSSGFDKFKRENVTALSADKKLMNAYKNIIQAVSNCPEEYVSKVSALATATLSLANMIKNHKEV